jgi:protein-S-isoprenylcysteine O-methyltransferase Ste14
MMSVRMAWLLLGTIIGAYWLRVWKMARRVRRKTGRGANFIPAERLGRRLRLIWIPIVAVWIAGPFFSAAAPDPAPLLRPIWSNPIAAWTGAALAGGCFIATIFCWKTMGRSWRMGIDPAERTELIVSGPFTWLRHPIYALSQLMMLASVASLPSPLLLSAGTLHLILLHWEARREERHMLIQHGDIYEQYRARVGGFFPKLPI